jgi:hypothetical protein
VGVVHWHGAAQLHFPVLDLVVGRFTHPDAKKLADF